MALFETPARGLVVSDLDGTLHFPGFGIHPAEIECLRELETQGYVRAIATGRSWESALNVLPPDFPIEFLIFSSGAGIVEWATQRLIVSHNLDGTQTEAATRAFLEFDLDFMVHAPIPDAATFAYRRTQRPNPDFERRLAHFGARGRLWSPAEPLASASQLLAICPEGDPERPYNALKQRLWDLSVVRATSPLDGKSIWLEAFSAKVSKALAAQFVAERFGLSASESLAVGNDYNDWSMLEWAGRAFVMRGAPEPLRAHFPSVEDGDRLGVGRAVALWTRERRQGG